jgi:linoleate 10R-lipoxygenase
MKLTLRESKCCGALVAYYICHLTFAIVSVGNLAHIHFAANAFSMPLKSEEHPNGIYTEYELYQLLSLVFNCLYLDLDQAKSFPLRQATKKLAGQLSKIVEINVKTVSLTGWIAGVVDGKLQNKHLLTDYGVHVVRELLAAGLSVDEAAYAQIIPIAVAMVANQAKLVRISLFPSRWTY